MGICRNNTETFFLLKAIGYLISPTFTGYPHCVKPQQWGKITVSVLSDSYYLYGNTILPVSFKNIFTGIITHMGGAPTGSVITELQNNKIGIKLGLSGTKPSHYPWVSSYIAIGI